MSATDGNGKGYDAKRRRLLQIGGTVVLSTLFPQAGQTRPTGLKIDRGHHHNRAPVQGNTAARTLRKFDDALPIPSLLRPSGMLKGVPFYEVKMTQFRQQLHHGMPPTTLWGYNGTYPGPTFDVRRGSPIAVRWENELPGTHFLPIDTTLHGAEANVPQVRTVVHLHGMNSLPDSDGYPDAWFTNGFKQTGPYFKNKIYNYPNDHEATTLWYHDHTMGITRLNVYAGLAGLYLIRDNNEDSLGLPRGEYEIPLVIQDRFFNTDGSLLYPVQTPGDPDTRVPPVWIPEFFGDTVLVNGKVWPYLEVEPRKYRFRFLNGSNARVYHMTLQESTETGQRLNRPGPVFQQIGSDSGFLPAAVTRTDLLMAPAERIDVVVDFSGLGGKTFVLDNDAKAPYPDGDDIVPGDVMMFKVSRRAAGPDKSRVPAVLNTIPLIDPASAVTTRDIVLSELDSADPYVNPIMAMINGAMWSDPVTETPKAGTTEIWRLINMTGDAHPIHIHLVEFQVLDVQPFDQDQYPTSLVFTADPAAPANYERPAWKDTVVSLPGTVTRIIMKFDLPAGTPVSAGEKFRYVYHCHILEHEENDMMRPFDVIG